MTDNPLLKYHHALAALVGETLAWSEEARRNVAAREKACGATFPPSVKEWFSIGGAKQMFDETGNHLESLEELGRPEETRQGYLRVATEVQGVVGW